MSSALRSLTLTAAVCLLSAISTRHVTAQESTTLGGYGEIHYTNPSGRNTPAEVNLRRFVMYLAHTFDEHISFRSELEVEDAKVEGGSAGGEVALEQAFLDYRFSDRLTLRTGLVLIPVGIINETHEPPSFNGVDRPAFDHDVIPTTWRELGVGIVGALPLAEGLSYRVYVVNGLVASGFSDAEGIRAGRQEGRDASFANPSVTGRVEWVRPGLRVGGSFWYGGTTAGDSGLGTGAFSAPVALVSADVRYDRGAFSARGVIATIHVSDADTINALYGTAVGSRITGGYVEGAYDVLTFLAPRSKQRLNAFVRHERYDTQGHVPAGTTRDPQLARRVTTLGLTYKPLFNVAFKGDYEVRRTAASGGVGAGETLRFGIGYQF